MSFAREGAPWTLAEDDALVAARDDDGETWGVIGRLLCRSALACGRRYDELRAAAGASNGKRARRACLGPLCAGRRTFASSGPGNRMCGRCREAAAVRGSAFG